MFTLLKKKKRRRENEKSREKEYPGRRTDEDGKVDS